MTTKSFNVQHTPGITPALEKSVSKAFQEFGKKRNVPESSGRLRTFKAPAGASCSHAWKPVNLSKEHAEYIKSVTEEDPPLGATKWCANCGAVSYWENGQLWLYDATTRYYGKIPKQKRGRQPSDSRT